MISGNISITLLIKNDVISIFTQVVMPYDINLGSRNHRAYVSQSITSVLRKIGLICTRHISWWYHHAAIPCFYDRHYPLKPSVFKMQQEVRLDLLLLRCTCCFSKWKIKIMLCCMVGKPQYSVTNIELFLHNNKPMLLDWWLLKSNQRKDLELMTFTRPGLGLVLASTCSKRLGP